jgi:hypothetical protein
MIMTQVNELSRARLIKIVSYIQETLWADSDLEEETLDVIDVWDPDKEWEPDMLEDIASVLIDAGLKPDTYTKRD